MIKKNLGILTIIFFLAYLLRVMFLPNLALTFGYDQARDAFIVQEILSGDFKILGPPASSPGLYHGVFYYYFLAPAYALGKNPIIAAYWTAIFNASVVFIVYYLALLFTKNRLAGIFSALLFAVSFESVQYAVWLSNPTLGVWTVPLTYLGLWIWTKNKKSWGAMICALGLGLSIQSEIFLAYHIVPIVIWLWASRNKISRAQIFKFVLVLATALSTMILVEFKFGFKGIHGALSLINTGESVSHGKSFGDFLILFLNQIGRTFAHNSYPGNIGYGAMLVLALIVFSVVSWKKSFSWEPFLILWLLSHIWVASVGGTSTPFLMVGIGPAVSILLGIYIAKWWGSNKKIEVICIMAILVFGNISNIIRENTHGQTIFSIQKDMTLSNQKKAIDYTYSAANGKEFSINTITSPLWINTVWSYLYNWYGLEKYGYIPQYHGKDQVGQLGNNLGKTKAGTILYFLIGEPLQGIPPKFVEETQAEENSLSKLLEEKTFGQITVQKREKNEH